MTKTYNNLDSYMRVAKEFKFKLFSPPLELIIIAGFASGCLISLVSFMVPNLSINGIVSLAIFITSAVIIPNPNALTLQSYKEAVFALALYILCVLMLTFVVGFFARAAIGSLA